MMHWSNCSLGEAGEAWVEQPHQAAGIVTDENEEKKKGGTFEKKVAEGTGDSKLRVSDGQL